MPEPKPVALESLEGVEMPCQRQIWERLPGESARAWSAFQAYRDARNRTLSRVGETLTPKCSKQNVWRWYARWRWQERSGEFDIHQDRLHQQEMAKARTEMDKRHVQIGVAMQSIGTHALAQLQERLQEKLPLNLSVDEARSLISEGARLERTAHGPTHEDGQYCSIVVNLGDHEYDATSSEEAEPIVLDGNNPPFN